MSWRSWAIAGLAVGAMATSASAQPLGRTPSAADIAAWDIDVRPDGLGLPAGSGTVARGKAVYTDNCEGCHGANGTGGTKGDLVGGRGTLATDHPVKTVGSFWPYATTLFDYVRRAMPYPAPGSLSADDTYAVVAYVLNLNGLVPANGRLDAKSLPKVRMPNRDGFRPDAEFRQGDSR
jgi:cytochrome c